MSSIQKHNLFKDFDLSFSVHPLTGDIGVKTGVNAINQSINNLVNTNFYERLFRPSIGCNIRGILFEPADPITIADLRQAINDTIVNHEPRVKLIDINVEDWSERNSYRVQIVYEVSFEKQPIQLDLVLERLR